MKTNENAAADPAASANGLANPNNLERTREILFGPSLREFEKRFIARVLVRSSGSLTKTADALGMHRNTLSRKIAEHKIRRRSL